MEGVPVRLAYQYLRFVLAVITVRVWHMAYFAFVDGR